MTSPAAFLAPFHVIRQNQAGPLGRIPGEKRGETGRQAKEKRENGAWRAHACSRVRRIDGWVAGSIAREPEAVGRPACDGATA
jgi:hypothetical protein